MLLGEPMVRFHEALARRAREQPQFHFHYVTAREMYNLARAGEVGWKGPVAEARNYDLLWDGREMAAGSSPLTPSPGGPRDLELSHTP
jgi:hypothetical protein